MARDNSCVAGRTACLGRSAFALATVAWALGALNEWRFFLQNLEMPLGVVLGIVLVPALVFGLVAVLWRYFVLRGAPGRAAIALATTWVCFEFALQRLTPNSTFGNLAYTQMDFLPLVQIASITGISGISFLLLLAPATAAALPRIRFTASVALLLAVAISWGAWRLGESSSQPQGRKVLVGLVSADARAFRLPDDPKVQQSLFAGYASEVDRLVAHGARLVVIPEKIARLKEGNTAAIDGAFATTTRTRAVVVVGIERWTESGKVNEARIYADGRLQGLYLKHHMVPGFESHLKPGTWRKVLIRDSMLWGVTICKDMDFPVLGRAYGKDGVGLEIVPAWDFDDDDWLHDRMAVLRGVESGFNIARAAKQGLLTLSDAYGRVLAEKRSDSAEFATLLGAIPTGHKDTLYTRWGDWFGWVCVATLVWLVAVNRIPKLLGGESGQRRE